MITIIFGLPGSGKTSLMTYFAIRSMFDYYDDVRACKRLIKRYNANGYNMSTDFKHLTFADYCISAVKEGYFRRNGYFIDGFEVGLPNSRHKTVFIPPYSSIFLD
jgi:hypothetical protein